MKQHIERLIENLNLSPHPEGGYYKETYRSEGVIQPESDESFYPVDRHFSTAIYYLLEGADTSSFHRIRSDETWHFYSGSPATIHIIHPDSLYQALHLGPDIEQGQAFQHTVPGESWFGVSVDKPDSYLLAGCTVAPGFDFDDFEMGDPYKLKQAFPEHAAIIEKLS
ncbi:cupin domain-containing protein [Rhodohalobacter sp. 8-1]|uniref:cupin domain-containing protein n=1 Tax=Rhodohalobacter sp. 8-1 TaxID=3131972 RepID=UPI0030EB399B